MQLEGACVAKPGCPVQSRGGSVVGAEDDTGRRYPAPLELALARLDADPAECVYVGDAPEDIEMARRAGVRPIGVLGPFPTATRVRAARPEVLLPSIRHLSRYLRALN